MTARFRKQESETTAWRWDVQACVRLSLGLSGLALLSACSSGGNQAATGFSTDYYIEHAAGNYQPPGPPADPWGPYVRIAAARFDVPEKWIREVMRVESGGHEYIGGQLTVSPAGAMGLMQLEPETYQEMAASYGLGADPFNPYDNIMAGTAYIHEMYAVYGSPGFLAAYNAGPGRLDSYMDDHEPLPNETSNYVAMIAPKIQGYYPNHRSEADQLALNTMPAGAGHGLLPAGVAAGFPAPEMPSNPAVPVDVAAIIPASMPEPNVYQREPARSVLLPPPEHRPGFSLISSAMADTPMPRSFSQEGTASRWAIQVGVYSNRENAKAALGIAELSAVRVLIYGEPVVVVVRTGSSKKYHARFVGLSHDHALDACQRLEAGPTGCLILSPDAQS